MNDKFHNDRATRHPPLSKCDNPQNSVRQNYRDPAERKVSCISRRRRERKRTPNTRPEQELYERRNDGCTHVPWKI